MRLRRSSRLAVVLVASAGIVLSACGDDPAADPTTPDAGDEPTASEPADTASETASGMGSETPSGMGSETASEMGGMTGSEATGAAGADVQAIQDAGVIRVGTKFDQPLFGVQTPSGPVGFDVQIAKIIAEELGVTPEFTESVSANREPFLQQDQVDMVAATYTINDERDKVVDFAGPYYVAGQDIMVPKGNPEGIEGIDSLNTPDITTCTAEGSTSLQNLNEMAPEADILTFDTYSKCADAVRQGRADAVSTDNVILLGLIDAAPEEFELVENPFTEEPYGIGVPEGSDLRCYVNGVLAAAYEDGRWATAFEETVGTVGVATPEPPELNNEGC